MSDLTIQWPDADLERLEAAKERLCSAREGLLERTNAELLDPLCAVLELWRDPASRWRRELLAQHPSQAGFTGEVVRAGLELGLARWDGPALRELVDRELAPQLDRRPGLLAPFPLTSVLLAGSIPMPSLLQCLLPLLVRSPALVRSASRDPVTARLVAASIADVDPELGRCIEVVSFPSDDRPSLESFLAADCVVASGSDETIALVSQQLTADQRFAAYGHRLSLAVLGPHATRGESLERVASALALDVALWDQLGCLSPVSVFTLDEKPGEAAGRLAEALADALAARQRELPRGAIDAASAAAIRRERTGAEMRAADGRDVVVHASEGTLFTVIQEDDSVWLPSPGHRFLRVHPVGDLAALVAVLRPLARHLAAVAVAGFGDSGESSTLPPALVRALTQLGVSRVCRPGALQAPPLAWRHDGLPLLLPIARFTDLEDG